MNQPKMELCKENGKPSSCAKDRHHRPTKCSICGRKCQFYYYGSPSCDCCGQFFRRAVIQSKEFVCKNDGNCVITSSNSCRSCRLDKCILTGMDVRAVGRSNKIDISPELMQIFDKRKEKLLQSKGMLAKQGDKGKDGQPLPKMDVLENFCIDVRQLANARLLQQLLVVEKCKRRIHDAFMELADDYLVRFDWLEQILASGDNILARAEQFSSDPEPLSVRDRIIFYLEMEQTGVFHPRIYKSLVVDRLLVVGLAKALPAFRELSLADRTILIRQLALPINIFYNSFRSAKFGSRTYVRKDGVTAISMIQTGEYKNDPRIQRIAEKNFSRSVEPFMQIEQLSDEELVLLLAIMCSHSAISELSAHAKELLYEESVRYSKMLLELIQCGMGPTKGASRFADCMRLMEMSFHAAHYNSKFVAEMDQFHRKMGMGSDFPRCLVTIT